MHGECADHGRTIATISGISSVAVVTTTNLAAVRSPTMRAMRAVLSLTLQLTPAPTATNPWDTPTLAAKATIYNGPTFCLILALRQSHRHNRSRLARTPLLLHRPRDLVAPCVLQLRYPAASKPRKTFRPAWSSSWRVVSIMLQIQMISLPHASAATAATNSSARRGNVLCRESRARRTKAVLWDIYLLGCCMDLQLARRMARTSPTMLRG